MARRLAKPPLHKPERRVFSLDQVEIRADSAADEWSRRFAGHASVFNTLSEELWGFYERVGQAAFDDGLAAGADVRLLFNHDPNRILARTKAGTLTLATDDDGLGCDALFPDTTYARDLAESMDRGDVDGMSFGFRVLEDSWADEEITIEGRTFTAKVRTLLKVELFDVSIVVYPAYTATDAELNAAAYRYLGAVPAWHPDQCELVGCAGGCGDARASCSSLSSWQLELAEFVEPRAETVIRIVVDASALDPVEERIARLQESLADLDAARFFVRSALPGGELRLADGTTPEELRAWMDGLTAKSETPEERARGQRAERRYQRSVDFVSGTPWLMHPQAIQTIVGILAERKAGVQLTEEEIRERLGTNTDDDLDELFDEEADAEEKPGPPVAVIPVHGPIVPRSGMFTRVSGMTSVQALQQEFREALADPKVKAIVFDISSPGGSSELVAELADEIRAARGGEKPIVAVANAFAFSAAYWIASAADELVLTPSGAVGSVGVWTAHEDWSKFQEDLGVKTTLVYAGKYKVEGNPFEPLGAEAKAELQRHVDAVYDQFVDAVAAGRRVARQKVLDDFGQGRTVLPADALNVGMVDRIATIDETIARLAEPTPEERGHVLRLRAALHARD